MCFGQKLWTQGLSSKEYQKKVLEGKLFRGKLFREWWQTALARAALHEILFDSECCLECSFIRCGLIIEGSYRVSAATI
jgi:hypothetical protein